MLRVQRVLFLVVSLCCLSVLPAPSFLLGAGQDALPLTTVSAMGEQRAAAPSAPAQTVTEASGSAPWDTVAKRRVGFGVLFLGVAALALGGWRRHRQTGWGRSLLLVAPTVILVGGYLASGAGVPPARQPVPAPTPAVVKSSGKVPEPSTRAEMPPRDGRLIYAIDGNIWALATTGGAPIKLTPDIEIGTYATNPSLSPDGTTIAFVQATLPRDGQAAPSTTGLVTELYLMDVSGAGRRRILAPPRPEATLADPVWIENGTALLYTLAAPIFGPDGRVSGATAAVERLDLATNERTVVAPNGTEPTIAPPASGNLYAYVAIEPDGALPQLWLATLDGQRKHKLVGPEAGFQSFHRPRFSPDGQFLVFAAAGGPQSASGRSALRGGGAPLPLRQFLELVAPRSASAHGLPQDLWIIRTDGTDLRRLTQLNADEPSPAWAPDGQQLAFLASDGLYIVDREGRGATKIWTKGGYSALIWSPR